MDALLDDPPAGRFPLLFAVLLVGSVVVGAATAETVRAQDATGNSRPDGVRMLENKSFDRSSEAREEILELYEDLRVPDVSDAMDLIGLQDIGLMDRRIRPLWRDTDEFTHRFVGFALTVRYVPSDVRVGEGSFDNLEEAREWKGEQYGRAGEPFMEAARPGDVLVIDSRGAPGTGHIGSNNSLGWAAAGIRGVVTNAHARDTDEIVMTKEMPVYTRNAYSGRGIRPGRSITESYNFPVNCGGVLVYPGDVVVGDGDGVIVVPREHARQVGRLAREIYEGDEASRREKYEQLGIPLDETVRDR